MSFSVENLRGAIAGLKCEVPLLDGSRRVYINFDNAATTPSFYTVLQTIERFCEWYSSVHRGTGFKSVLSTYVYEHCREVVQKLVGSDPKYHTIIFTQNATDSLNKICRHLNLSREEKVLTTWMEHHSNLLPWQFMGQAEFARIVDKDGSLDIDHLAECLDKNKGQVRLVAVTGASNVTGSVPPIHEIARIAHEHNAQMLVDAAQLIAHREVKMGEPSDAEHIDFLVFSGHKMYAPFGSGVLVGPREFFEEGRPAILGGGSIDIVTPNEVEWAEVPEKEEAGTPNLIGALAIAKAAEILSEIGFSELASHEREITSYALKRLSEIKGISIYGDRDTEIRRDRVSVIPIIAPEIHHSLLAAILGYEWGIGVRHGCFCAQPYVMNLLGLSLREVDEILERARKGDHADLPGFVRISFGLYNTREEIDYLIKALQEILSNGPKGRYILNRSTGEYKPEGFEFDWWKYFPV
jgi:selenocysteine lyase/cysteine desulfurase